MERILCLLLLLTLVLSSSCRGNKAKLGMEVIYEPPIVVETEKAAPEKTIEKPADKQEDIKVISNSFPIDPVKNDIIAWREEDTAPYIINWKEIKEEIPRKKFPIKINVNYPEIRGLANTTIEKNLDLWIKELIDPEIQDFKKRFLSSTDEDPYDLQFGGSCKIMVLTPSICSILFDYQICYGRCNRFTKILNIDLKNNRKFQPSDFFKPNVNYKKLLMDYCRADLKKQYEEYYQEKMGEQFTMLRDNGCTEERCSQFNVLSDGFFLDFDVIFTKGCGRWSVKVPFSALGESCILKPVENAYGFFECPKGWKQIEKGGYRIKYPVVLDENKNIKNIEILNDTDIQIEIPVIDAKILPSGKPSYFNNATMLIQQRYFDTLPEFKESNPEDNRYSRVFIDHVPFVTYSSFQRVFDIDPSKRKIVDLHTFQEVSTKSILSITFTINYDYFSDWTEDGRPNESDEWKENQKKIYGQINQVFSTLHLQ
jgi:hypothetical protein